MNVIVYPKPDARFSVNPVPPKENDSITFIINDKSSFTGNSKFRWTFSEDEIDSTFSTNDFKHMFKKSGRYFVTMIGTNQYGCKDTSGQWVEAVVNPLVFVPNAFTPGRPPNDVIKVIGYGITGMRWR